MCGGKLVQRKDDNPETVRDRLEVYHRETEPLKGFYEARGILKTVEDQPTVAGTTQAILRALGVDRMITLKSAHEIELMRRAGKITAAARALARDMVKPGVTTQQIDKAVYKFITRAGSDPVVPALQRLSRPACASPSTTRSSTASPVKRVLQEGDIVSVDVGAFIGGFHGDCAGTYPCGQVSDEAHAADPCHPAELLRGASSTPGRAIACPTSPPPFRRMPRVTGYCIVREYVGHGIGRNMHEAPEVPNYRHAPAMAPACCGA